MVKTPDELPNPAPPGELCGVWIDDAGLAHLALATPEGRRIESRIHSGRLPGSATRPWCRAWGSRGRTAARRRALPLAGPRADAGDFDAFVRGRPNGAAIDWIRPLENQYLLQRRRRLFGDLTFPQLRRWPTRHRDRTLGRERVQRCAPARRSNPGDRAAVGRPAAPAGPGRGERLRGEAPAARFQ